jgi:hypothetical protein
MRRDQAENWWRQSSCGTARPGLARVDRKRCHPQLRTWRCGALGVEEPIAVRILVGRRRYPLVPLLIAVVHRRSAIVAIHDQAVRGLICTGVPQS